MGSSLSSLHARFHPLEMANRQAIVDELDRFQDELNFAIGGRDRTLAIRKANERWERMLYRQQLELHVPRLTDVRDWLLMAFRWQHEPLAINLIDHLKRESFSLGEQTGALDIWAQSLLPTNKDYTVLGETPLLRMYEIALKAAPTLMVHSSAPAAVSLVELAQACITSSERNRSIDGAWGTEVSHDLSPRSGPRF